MADVRTRGTVNTPRNIKDKGVLCISDCECYSLMQSDVQALENEVKSMSETINILKDERKYDCANKGARKPFSTYAEKLKLGSTPCCKCAQLESTSGSNRRIKLSEINKQYPTRRNQVTDANTSCGIQG